MATSTSTSGKTTRKSRAHRKIVISRSPKRPTEVVDREERTRLRRLKWPEEVRNLVSQAVDAFFKHEPNEYLNEDGSTNIDLLLASFAPPSYLTPLASEPLARRTRDEFVYWDMCCRGLAVYNRTTYFDSQQKVFLTYEDLPRPIRRAKTSKTDSIEDASEAPAENSIAA